MTVSAEHKELIDFIASFTHDPLGHVLASYPWGKEGTDLANKTGPRKWQRDFLIEVGDALKAGRTTPNQVIQKAVCSGHGVGKTALVAWIIKWALDTCVDARGVVTANTKAQLTTKTWAELSKWHRLSINKAIFELTATALYSTDPDHEKTWRFDLVTWSEHNTEAFAGLHNEGKRIVLIFDEASAIPDKIWEVSEGALTDSNTEILWFVFGNPTRNTGRFRECFGKYRHRWTNLQLDSRKVEGTNLKLFAEWIEDYGEDSDFARVRIRGVFPRASSLQFISGELVLEAQKREAYYNHDDPLIMALDVARGGDDFSVFRFRRGLDARSIPAVRIPGSECHDSMRLVSKALELFEEYKPNAFMFDGTGVGGPVGDRIRQLGRDVYEVTFGAVSPDIKGKYANMRAYIWGKMKAWLQNGGAVDDSPVLEQDLTSVEYDHNDKDQLRLEKKKHMKERGLASPDDGDALAMTFAYYVAPIEDNRAGYQGNGSKSLANPDRFKGR